MSEKADIKELAVATWRLEKWLDNLNTERKMAARSALRSIKKYIGALGIEIQDPIGAKFDPGLAVEVVNNESDGNDEDLIIIETLSPYIYQNNELIQHARVIIGTVVKEKNTSADDKKIDESPSAASDAKNDTETETQMVSKAERHDKSTVAGEEEEVSISQDEIERMMKYAKIL